MVDLAWVVIEHWAGEEDTYRDSEEVVLDELLLAVRLAIRGVVDELGVPIVASEVGNNELLVVIGEL